MNAKRTRWEWIWMSLLLLVPLGLLGLTNEEVVKMVEVGLGEETIILAVKNAEDVDFDTSAEALVELKEAGVSESVIQAMITSSSGGGAATASDGSIGAGMEFPDVPSESVMPPKIQPEEGSRYYTRINFWYEGDKSIATNYTRGILVPINTEVELVELGRKAVTVRLPGGQKVEIQNVPKYTGADVDELASRYLADEETVIDKYGEDAARQIRTGVMRLGMTKDQVLLTRGYPPVHETPSLESDRWVYWSSRFVKLTLVFENGRLSIGRGLY